jgi:phenylalanyl-tRNA synthetase alpha chain
LEGTVSEDLHEALEQLEQARAEALHAINEAASTGDLEQARIEHTGKRSPLSRVMQAMGRLQSDERKRLGAEVNAAKQDIENALSERSEELGRAELAHRLSTERLDVTLPGREPVYGYRNPLLQTVRDLLGILSQMGFSIYEGPEVEWELYNFDMLNVPKDHPSRDLQDTFWVAEGVVLRTQTSPAQIRYMLEHKPPIRVAVPGFTYRNEAEDASHGDRFYQIEGLVVDTNISLGDLKGTMTEVAHRYFGRDRRVRFRPHYFPFTEPSAELDIECVICRGSGCRSCGGEGWLELGGCGMVHPKVLRACSYDPDELSGFAFGIGPDRYSMMKYEVNDLRLFREDDLRFLGQFN